jgi:TolA-binding protein
LALPIVLAALAWLPAACNKTVEVERFDQVNRVQDQRLTALEEGMGAALRAQAAELQDLRKILEGRTETLTQRLDQMAAEQTRLSEAAEVNQSQLKRMERRLDDQLKALAQFRHDLDNDLDKLRLQMKDVEALLKSPIAGLPAATEMDKRFREAHFLLISGQVDLAADRFGQFAKDYPDDKRRPDALFRQGQAFFLERKYDIALVPLYELVEKYPKHKQAAEARWLLARALEETGDVKLAREFYALLIAAKSPYSADAARRVALMARLDPAKPEPGKAAPAKKGDPPAPAKPESGKP